MSMASRRLPLPKRFNVAMTEAAYLNLRALNAKYAFGNNYLLTFLLENLEAVTEHEKLDQMYKNMAEVWGAPEGSM
jgi:hypothetical protein